MQIVHAVEDNGVLNTNEPLKIAPFSSTVRQERLRATFRHERLCATFLSNSYRLAQTCTEFIDRDILQMASGKR